MKPLLINALGRSGTTLAMWLLASHEEIAGHTQYPCELRLIGHLCHPDNAHIRSSLLRYPFQGQDELLGQALKTNRPLQPPDVERIYRRIAAAKAKTPRYFLEKWMPAIDMTRVAEVFAGLQTITIFRDPRDIALSIRALDARRGYPGFHEKPGMSDTESLAILRRKVELLLANMRTAPTFVINYDELVSTPEEPLAGALSFLGVDASRPAVARMIERAGVFDAERHRTSSSTSELDWPLAARDVAGAERSVPRDDGRPAPRNGLRGPALSGDRRKSHHAVARFERRHSFPPRPARLLADGRAWCCTDAARRCFGLATAEPRAGLERLRRGIEAVETAADCAQLPAGSTELRVPANV